MKPTCEALHRMIWQPTVVETLQDSFQTENLISKIYATVCISHCPCCILPSLQAQHTSKANTWVLGSLEIIFFWRSFLASLAPNSDEFTESQIWNTSAQSSSATEGFVAFSMFVVMSVGTIFLENKGICLFVCLFVERGIKWKKKREKWKGWGELFLLNHNGVCIYQQWWWCWCEHLELCNGWDS